MLGEQAARLWQAEVLAPTPVLAVTLLAAYHDSAERSVSWVSRGAGGGEFPKFLSLRELRVSARRMCW